ncbi:hypothetical protein ACOMHN_034798 [Nucella lapillus]
MPSSSSSSYSASSRWWGVQVALYCGCLILQSSWAVMNTTIDYDNPANYDYPKDLDMCSMPWRPVLKVDPQGRVVYGSVEEVKSQSLRGSLFRIKLIRPEGPYLLNVDNTNVKLENVCAESIWHVSDNGTHISTNPEWRYYLLCTDGSVSVINSPIERPPNWTQPASGNMVAAIQDAEKNFGTVTNESVDMVWYVKNICQEKPTYSHALDGTQMGGSFKNLKYMVNLGEARCVIRDRGYSFTMNNIVIGSKGKEINGQNIGHISQEFTQTGLAFKLVPYYWHASLTTSGHRDNTKYFVGTTQPRGHNNDFVPLDWYVDRCWKKVYVNNMHGEPLWGTLHELIFLISLGHRVRVRYDNTILEANSIRITENTVVVQSIEEMKRRGGKSKYKYFFNTETMWQWSTIHTTGKVRTYNFFVSNMRRYDSQTLKREVHWMVDTRTWNRVYTTPPGPYTRYENLVEAVERGASIRFSVQQDQRAGFLFTHADNVRLDRATGTVYAQCLRHVSDKKDPSREGEYEIQEYSPFYWFLMISSDGFMTMSAWKTQSRTPQYSNKMAPQVNVTWYASR